MLKRVPISWTPNSSFRGIQETIASYGLFCSFHTDRGSDYFYAPEANGKVDKTRLTQVGRALKQLGIVHIAAYSPEARGRSERMFCTLQGRLVNELRRLGITDMTAANRRLHDVYLPRHNQQFMVKAEVETSAFVPTAGLNIADVLCIHEERVVGQDNCVHYRTMKLQILPSPLRHHYVKMHDAMMIRQKPPQKIEMPIPLQPDRLIAVAIRDRSAHRQQQHLRQRIGHLMRRTPILDHRKMIEQRLQPRPLAKSRFPLIHARLLQQRAHGFSILSIRKAVNLISGPCGTAPRSGLACPGGVTMLCSTI